MKEKKEKKQEAAPFSDLPKGKRFLANALVLVIGLAVVVTIAILGFKTFLPSGYWLNIVDGNSMYPTLQDGQFVFSNHSQPQRGDLVTSRFPEQVRQAAGSEAQAETMIIKRLIGIPGDQIRIDATGVYVNGERLMETYLTREAMEATFLEGRHNELTLGQNEYYLLGDNRGASNDSRYFGPVAGEDLQYVQTEIPGKDFWVTTALLVAACVAMVIIYSLLDALLVKLFEKIFGSKARKEAEGAEA